ncbi:hypothetical protein [Acrocarpospora pleiomorpha]|uniref:hypothetical protein n=1 Tax=Acrocarpospora pleiomorpha TaxID=90975 RepID=UPI0012D2B5E3|nr:hypothetical protein [Acrocarpospora pleiomorpha]
MRIDWRRGQGIATLTEESCHGDTTATDDGCHRNVVTNMATRPLEIVARGPRGGSRSRRAGEDDRARAGVLAVADDHGVRGRPTSTRFPAPL